MIYSVGVRRLLACGSWTWGWGNSKQKVWSHFVRPVFFYCPPPSNKFGSAANKKTPHFTFSELASSVRAGLLVLVGVRRLLACGSWTWGWGNSKQKVWSHFVRPVFFIVRLPQINLGRQPIKKPRHFRAGLLVLVGVRRLELPTPCPPDMCASQLRHTPINSGAKVTIHFIFSNAIQKNEVQTFSVIPSSYGGPINLMTARMSGCL